MSATKVSFEKLTMKAIPTAAKDSGNNESPVQISRQNVSFTFSKRISKQLPGNKLSEDDNRSEKSAGRDFIESISDKVIKSTVAKEEKKQLVINQLRRNNDIKPARSSLEEMAITEVLKETAEQNEKWEKREVPNFTITIPALVQSENTRGGILIQKLDTASCPNSSTMKDYEEVPVEDFAAAYFRGLGVNPSDPVGTSDKKFAASVVPKIRSRGLGLGADTLLKKKSKLDESKKKEELPLVKGSYVKVLHGNHKGHYGQVEGLDEFRVIVKLCQEETPLSLPELCVEVVSKAEFKKESKVINRSAYDEYKSVHESKDSTDGRHSTKHHSSGRKDDHKERDTIQSTENSQYQSRKELSNGDASHTSKKSHKKRNHSSRDSSPYEDRKRKREVWVCPQLRVRFVDKDYKKGKYFNQKMRVEDVASADSCVCITEDGKYLEDINHKHLETVVPRSESSFVKVVMGKYRGQIGTILKRDKTNCIATINFLSNREKVVKIDYDSICEYIGDVSQYE